MPILIRPGLQLLWLLMMQFQQHIVVGLLLDYSLDEREYLRGIEEGVLEDGEAVEVAQALVGVLFCEGLD